jgi:hypothetical protein
MSGNLPLLDLSKLTVLPWMASPLKGGGGAVLPPPPECARELSELEQSSWGGDLGCAARA